MKIYNGWVVSIEGEEWKVVGRNAIRKTSWILLKHLSSGAVRSFERNMFINHFNEGNISYIRSESP